ncbi:MAG: UDP-glucose/GDP-mannose dehydrogenase family protein [Candidatus Thiodiazotropha endolucinida]
MKISIFGLGYVGGVSAGCLATDGHHVIGVDTNTKKVDLINKGVTPIIEKDIGEMIEKTAASGYLRATTDISDAVNNSDISLICVGTPSQLNGNLDLSHVRKVCEEIGTAIKHKSTYHVVVVRSTMLPGSMADVVIPTLEDYSGKRIGIDFGVCNNPEFLREGTAVWDYYNPPKTVIGETDVTAGDMLVELYKHMDAPLIRVNVETAEMVKYTDNAWHALKVAFANEIGDICKVIGVDGHEVMGIFCQDTKLNISSYYMKPGFAFGGSCLPKDVRALTYKGRSLDLDLPILNAILPSNQMQVRKGLEMITAYNKKKVGILGFAFKAGTDDLRESPLVEVIESLIGKGHELKIYDKNVNIAALTGANKNYILNHIPHISKLMVQTMDEVMKFADVVVIGNKSNEFVSSLKQCRKGQVIVDLVRITDETSEAGLYDGICW